MQITTKNHLDKRSNRPVATIGASSRVSSDTRRPHGLSRLELQRIVAEMLVCPPARKGAPPCPQAAAFICPVQRPPQPGLKGRCPTPSAGGSCGRGGLAGGWLTGSGRAGRGGQ